MKSPSNLPTARGGGASASQVVRSYSGSRYHAHTFQRAMEALEGWQGRVVGGGRIALDSRAKTISIYGYSKTFGRAPGCNEHSAQLIQQAYVSSEHPLAKPDRPPWLSVL